MAAFVDGEHVIVLAKDVVHSLPGIRHGPHFERHVVDSGYHPEGLLLMIVVPLRVLRDHLEELGELPTTSGFRHHFPPLIALLSNPVVVRILRSLPGLPRSYNPTPPPPPREGKPPQPLALPPGFSSPRWHEDVRS